jgi:hypothetical protein
MALSPRMQADALMKAGDYQQASAKYDEEWKALQREQREGDKAFELQLEVSKKQGDSSGRLPGPLLDAGKYKSRAKARRQLRRQGLLQGHTSSVYELECQPDSEYLVDRPATVDLGEQFCPLPSDPQLQQSNPSRYGRCDRRQPPPDL